MRQKKRKEGVASLNFNFCLLENVCFCVCCTTKDVPHSSKNKENESAHVTDELLCCVNAIGATDRFGATVRLFLPTDN